MAWGPGPFPVSQNPLTPIFTLSCLTCPGLGREEGNFVRSKLHPVEKQNKTKQCLHIRQIRTDCLNSTDLESIRHSLRNQTFFSEKLNFGVELWGQGKKNEKEIPNSSNSRARGLPWRKYMELRIKVLNG